MVARDTISGITHPVHDIGCMKNHRACANTIRNAALHDFSRSLFHDNEFLFGMMMRRVCCFAFVQRGEVTFKLVERSSG